MIVAIDGPAGAGKSTVARQVANRLGFGYLNTGSMYRAVTLLALRQGLPVDDEAAMEVLARSHTIRLAHVGAHDVVLIDGEDVTETVRRPEVTGSVSAVAAHASLRAEIVRLQREVLAKGDWVADGRDIGSVVCPDADVKVFLTAGEGERARRRHVEMEAGGDDVALGDVLQDIQRRDELDRTRSESPLVVAEGAVVIDSTNLSVDEVVTQIAALAGGVAA